MALKPEIGVPAALAVGTMVYTIYGRGLPASADIRQGQPDDEDIDAVRRQNAWMAAAVVSGVSLMTKDPNIFVVGGVMVIALDWLTRHANSVDPTVKALSGGHLSLKVPSGAADVAPVVQMDYTRQAVVA